MGTLSKTAKKSMQVEMSGSAARTAVAWVFVHRPGKMQRSPYATCFVKGEAERIVAADPENLYLVSFDERRR